MQWHGILFWTEKVGSHGWAWSLLLETVALWLWYKPAIGFRALALVASTLTLAGPVYQVSKPSIEAYYSIDDHSAGRTIAIEGLIAEKAQLSKQLDVYQANSLSRSGWLGAIEKANERIGAIDKELVELSVTKAEKAQWFFNWEIGMEVVALILFQLVAVLSITTISKQARSLQKETGGTKKDVVSIGGNSAETVETTPFEAVETRTIKPQAAPVMARLSTEIAPMETPKEEVENSASIGFVWKPTETKMETVKMEKAKAIEPLEVLAEMESYMQRTGKSYKELSELVGVSAKELSFLKNHEKRLQNGERTVSIPALERIRESIK